ncbi:hypothetical protein MATL_G00082350 [Megalops atlanticus]|uniref:Transforming acidic coiled-coil-containing protein C-terminal domain-containing protein n=1 Tax=Megalops atlanticus TaxID=7932 RepID=A0A9D3Q4S0_MEGAT|nr:hypothetical protein MATL_G00082350 [Megalops atlanticus]
MSWSMLSPVQWAKWTWSAVRGGGEEEEGTREEEEEEEGGGAFEERMRVEEEFSPEEEKSRGCSSDSEGHFETPEAESPIRLPSVELADPNANSTADLKEDGQVISGTAEVQNSFLDQNSNSELLPAPPVGATTGPVAVEGAVDALNNLTERPQSEAHPSPVPVVPEPVRDTLPDMPDMGMALGGEKLCNGHSDETEPQVKPEKARPPPLKLEETLNGPDPDKVGDADEIPVPKASYNSDPDQYDDNFNPFASGRSKLQNSPPPCCGATPPVEEAAPDAKPVKMEFGVVGDGGSVEAKRPPPRKLGKKPPSKLQAPKIQRPKPAQPAPEPAVTHSSEDIPIAKSSYSCNPSQWDDPNFNPFGSKGKMSISPVLPKGSSSFDPNNFDDTVDPFKPSESLAGGGLPKAAPPAEKLADEPVKHKLELPLEEEEGKGRQSPKKNKSRIITTTEQVRFLCFLLNACKVQKYENESLVLDICGEEEEQVVTRAPNISQRVAHATDEEKLASTVSAPKPGRSEKAGELLQCASPPASTKRLPSDGSQMKITDRLEEKDLCSSENSSVCCPSEPLKTTSTKSPTGSEGHDKGSPVLDSICISEADKAAVLTLIREEIITKEIEANEWKKKYEESRHEVIEMRKIVAEYEKTVAQMIEDEQRTNRTSQRTIQQLTMERDQALADLNSVERSLSDLFRRYENMKAVLEGFKKNEEVLKKCAQEYLARVKQEEQRYQTLKIHAEEKLDKANEEIALVRSKANSESVALHASLRKEQMKVESLERALEQKNQEIEELTKICDELIAKLGKTE